jgi:hypothetical protein
MAHSKKSEEILKILEAQKMSAASLEQWEVQEDIFWSKLPELYRKGHGIPQGALAAGLGTYILYSIEEDPADMLRFYIRNKNPDQFYREVLNKIYTLVGDIHVS